MIGVETLEGVPESPGGGLSNAGSSVSLRERLGENEMQKRGRSSTRGADGRDEPTLVSVAGGLASPNETRSSSSATMPQILRIVEMVHSTGRFHLFQQ